ncbi:MAG: tetratricopeptide repeat protein, partial [Prevotella sp.]|nr:tetratricopeptide repeat protein [Prevotella sp.]
EYDKSNNEDVTTVINLGNALQSYGHAYLQMDSLQRIRYSRLTNDYEWGIASLQLSNILINVKREKEAYDICQEIYAMSSKLQEDPRTLHWAVLMNLADYGISQKEYSIAERYSKEQMAWLDAHNYAENAEEKGWIYNKLGIVYMNNSRYDDSNKAYKKAEKILLPIYKKESSEYATILHNRGRLAQLQGKLDEAKILLTEAQQIQISVERKPMDKTVQYLNEVDQAIKIRL